MSIKDTNAIANRLSLRAPQRQSLQILDRVCEIVDLDKNADIAQALEVIKSEYPSIVDFERSFVSLCFALATGVGKTRLMGAFIAYMHRVYGVKNFFVVAPNLTIYQKLFTDFTPNTSKYVFRGISEFAQNPPILVNGDNYESQATQKDLFSNVVINIFNISKITAKDKGKLAKDDDTKNVPRIRRLNETIGESYYDYLANKKDLVLIMDESHRYRATAGWEALNDLKPILGLELTATPQIEKGKKAISFKNVIYNYPLACAIRDGFVKEPAVATRENFNPKDYTQEELEKIKLHDAICIHKSTKADLEIYARNRDVALVKPFVMIVATDINHAKSLEHFMSSKDFFEGTYDGKILVVHSNTSGEEKDEVIANLLTVEDPKNPIEIVIHVNMLKEGWDVTNLYTIVPLRAANSKTLVEQSIGRGLRLPYGKRVGEPVTARETILCKAHCSNNDFASQNASFSDDDKNRVDNIYTNSVDRLTIVSHDRFQEIVDDANKPDSLIRQTVILGKDIPLEGKIAATVNSSLDEVFSVASADSVENTVEDTKTESEDFVPVKEAPKPPVFKTEEEVKIAKITKEVIAESFENLSSAKELSKEDVIEEITQLVEKKLKEEAPAQLDLLDKDVAKIDTKSTIEKAVGIIQDMTISIPRILIVPATQSKLYFEEFTLDTANIRKYESVDSAILIKHLQSNEGYVINAQELENDKSIEFLIVDSLRDFDDINYEDNASVINSIAIQYANFMRSYAKDENEIKAIFLFNKKDITDFLHSQLQKNYKITTMEYKAQLYKGFRILKSTNFSLSSDKNEKFFRDTNFTKSKIKDLLFSGFKKSLYPKTKFDSDTERRFSEILEDSTSVEKWFKPSLDDIHIQYTSGREYLPDFIVEMSDKMLLCETKAEKDLTDELVLAKEKAAMQWCSYASEHSKSHSGKEWTYLLIPHTQVLTNMTLEALIAKYAKK